MRSPYRCYNRLHGISLESGKIPFSEVERYAERIGITDVDELMHYYDMVSACDLERLEYLAERRKKEQESD